MITLSSSGLPSGARVLGFRCDEAISQPYQIEIFVSVTDDQELQLDDAIGGRATLTLDRDDDKIPPFVFTGVIATAEILRSFGGKSLVRILVVPRLWLLGLSRHSRIFTNQKIPDIVARILEENGFGPDDYEMRLGSYDVEAHVCQYRESDLDFISRWMEREGIFYFFEHSESGERLILCDSRAYAHDAFGLPVRYVPQAGGDVSAGMSFRSFAYQKTTLPATVRLRDYDYARPNLSLSSAARVSPDGAGEVSVYGARFFTPRAGERLAQIRAEEFCARQRLARASGSRMHLRTGHEFHLDEHPRPELNIKYVTIEAHHEGNQATAEPDARAIMGFAHDDVYHVDVVAIPADVQFRAESKTIWPRIYGYENGIVEGDATSEYAQIDEQGRYKVKLMFDESESKGTASSTFMRMAQPHGGAVEGFHFPLRKGVEVLVSFLGGDPDRPAIVSMVPNALTPSPVNVNNHTLNVIQTGSKNRIEIDDLGGQERITISTPHAETLLHMGAPHLENAEHWSATSKSVYVQAGKHHTTKVGIRGDGNMETYVKDRKYVEIEKGDYETKVKKGDLKTTVDTGNAEYTVSAGTQTTNVQNKVTENYANNYETNVTLIRELNALRIKEVAKAKFERRVGEKGAGFEEEIRPGYWSANVPGWLSFDTTSSMNYKAGTEYQVTCPIIKMKAEGAGSEIKLTSAGKIIIEAQGVEINNLGPKSEWTLEDSVEYRMNKTFSFALAAGLDISTGLAVSVFGGIKVDATLSFSCGIKAAPAIELNLLKLNDVGAAFEKDGLKGVLAGLYSVG